MLETKFREPLPLALVDAIYRETAPLWRNVAQYAQHAVRFLSDFTGLPYPWPHMTGVDGVVFVADSSASMQEENLESMRNLQENLAEYEVDTAADASTALGRVRASASR